VAKSTEANEGIWNRGMHWITRRSFAAFAFLFFSSYFSEFFGRLLVDEPFCCVRAAVKDWVWVVAEPAGRVVVVVVDGALAD
jgi:hypothetical protein